MTQNWTGGGIQQCNGVPTESLHLSMEKIVPHNSCNSRTSTIAHAVAFQLFQVIALPQYWQWPLGTGWLMHPHVGVGKMQDTPLILWGCCSPPHPGRVWGMAGQRRGTAAASAMLFLSTAELSWRDKASAPGKGMTRITVPQLQSKQPDCDHLTVCSLVCSCTSTKVGRSR